MKLLDKKWWRGMSRVLALEPGAETSCGVVLDLNRGEVKVMDSSADMDGPATARFLEKHASLPVTLCLRGEFVFERMVSAQSTHEIAGAILGVFIENPDDFPVMRFPAEGGKVLASVIRKDKIDKITADWNLKPGRVTDVVFSEAVMALPLSLAPGNEFRNCVLNTGSRQYRLSGGLFAEETGAPIPIQAGIREVAGILETNAAFAFAASAALFTMLNAEGTASGYGPADLARKEHVTVSLMKNIAAAFAIFLVVSALGLVALRTFGENKKQNLQDWMDKNQTVLDLLKMNRAKLTARQELRAQLGGKTLRSSRVAWYCDRIGAIIPSGVNLEAMIFWPVNEELKKAGMKAAADGDWDLIITGKAGNSGPLATLSQKIETQEWVKEFKVVSSGMNYAHGGYDFVFVLKFNHAG